MGYGVNKPGYWGGRKHLTWKQIEGSPHGELDRALDIWQTAVGCTFTQSTSTGASVDFQFKNGGSTAQWSPSQKTLFLKGTETLGTVLHEIGHLLGMSHEHDRDDRRDAWYDANPGALGKEESIRQAGLRGANLVKYGNYDVDSIMQYPVSKYQKMTAPSAGDAACVKEINGW